MTTVKKLRLKDIVKRPLDINELNQIRGGVSPDIMPLAYGCESQVCTDDRSVSVKECTVAKCRITACNSGA